MTPFVLSLVFASAIAHTGWNLMASSQRAGGAGFYRRMLSVTSLVMLIPAGLGIYFSGLASPVVMGMAVVSGIFCGFYYLFLGQAYRNLDFSVAYPITRALPILILAFGDTFRGRMPSTTAWIGMILASAGVILTPMHRLGDLGQLFARRKMLGWTLLTALAIVGYTLVDKIASEAVPAGLGGAVQYGYILYLTAFVVVSLTPRLGGGIPDAPCRWRTCITASVFDFGGYLLVLWAYQLVRQASYVFAFRQVSLVMGVAMAFLLGRERLPAVRIAGVAMVTTGIMLVAFGR